MGGHLTTEEMDAGSRVGFLMYEELCQAKALLEEHAPAVAIYGGARITAADPYYTVTERLAEALSETGISVMSGGGPGIMEAANKGAQHGRPGLSIGLNITLDREPRPNDYQDYEVSFQHFAARKTVFCKYAAAFVVMPGGFGTLDELFEVLTLIQTHKSRPAPVILVGREFWEGLVSWIQKVMVPRGLVAPADLGLFVVEDDIEKVVKLCQQAVTAWK